MKKGFSILFLILFLVVLILLLIPPKHLVLFEQPEQTDLIVVLEGDYYIRLDKAYELATAGYSKSIYSPGLFLPENLEYIRKLKGSYPDIDFYSDATGKNTYQEAILTREYIKGKHIDSILLVTSDYHSRRAKMTFRMVLNDTKIISVPARIWTNPKYDYVYRTEMIRIIGAIILYWPELFK